MKLNIDTLTAMIITSHGNTTLQQKTRHNLSEQDIASVTTYETYDRIQKRSVPMWFAKAAFYYQNS